MKLSQPALAINVFSGKLSCDRLRQEKQRRSIEKLLLRAKEVWLVDLGLLQLLHILFFFLLNTSHEAVYRPITFRSSMK